MNVDATLQTIGIFTRLSLDEGITEGSHPNVLLIAYDKGFVEYADEGKVGYYLFDPDTEQSVTITREMAKALYTLTYSTPNRCDWNAWDWDNHKLCMTYA